MIDATSDEENSGKKQTDTIATVDRRTVLAATGCLAGMAGCTGGLPGGNDDTEGGNSETDTSTPVCEDREIIVEGPDQTTRCVAPVESDRSIEEYYGYDTETQNSSALVDELEEVDATVSFVYENTDTGDRSLVVVHDSPDGGTAGDAVMSFQGIDGTEWLVKDDPEPRSASEAYETPEATEGDSISAVWGWSGDSSLTDGGAIGPLGESFDVTTTHHGEGTAGDTTTTREGIDSWLFVDGGDLSNPIELVDFTDTESGDVSIRIATTDRGDGGDNGADGDSSGNDDGGNDDSTAGEETTIEETMSEDESGDGDGASFDVDLAVDQLPDAFDSLIIEFTGFELFTVTGSTVSFESDPVQVDLAELASSGASTDLMETTVPVDEYDNITYLIAVTDTTMSSDDDDQTFRSGEDGEVVSGFTDPDSLDLESGESITLTAEMSVQDAFDYDWKFEVGYSIDREA